MEEWKPIIGYEQMYAISNYGNVKSLDRLDSGGFNRLKGKLKKQYVAYGYSRVGLYANSKLYNASVARLVGLHFVDGFREGLQVNHIDGDKSNNHYSNLEWISGQENMNHAKHKRLLAYGAKNINAKLSDLQVQVIREALIQFDNKRGLLREIAKYFNVSVNSIWSIKHNRTWAC